MQNHSCAWRGTGLFGRMLDAPRAIAWEQEGRSAEPTAGQLAATTPASKVRDRKRHVTVGAVKCSVSLSVHEASAQDRDGAPK